MPMMCEECKCSVYLNEETDMYSCESGCACCNDPDYESDWDTHLRLINQLREYIKIHRISLEQDSEQLNIDMMNNDDLDSDEYNELEIEDISLNGQIIALSHILDYIDNTLTKGV